MKSPRKADLKVKDDAYYSYPSADITSMFGCLFTEGFGLADVDQERFLIDMDYRTEVIIYSRNYIRLLTQTYSKKIQTLKTMLFYIIQDFREMVFKQKENFNKLKTTAIASFNKIKKEYKAGLAGDIDISDAEKIANQAANQLSSEGLYIGEPDSSHLDKAERFCSTIHNICSLYSESCKTWESELNLLIKELSTEGVVDINVEELRARETALSSKLFSLIENGGRVFNFSEVEDLLPREFLVYSLMKDLRCYFNKEIIEKAEEVVEHVGPYILRERDRLKEAVINLDNAGRMVSKSWDLDFDQFHFLFCADDVYSITNFLNSSYEEFIASTMGLEDPDGLTSRNVWDFFLLYRFPCRSWSVFVSAFIKYKTSEVPKRSGLIIIDLFGFLIHILEGVYDSDGIKDEPEIIDCIHSSRLKIDHMDYDKSILFTRIDNLNNISIDYEDNTNEDVVVNFIRVFKFHQTWELRKDYIKDN